MSYFLRKKQEKPKTKLPTVGTFYVGIKKGKYKAYAIGRANVKKLRLEQGCSAIVSLVCLSLDECKNKIIEELELSRELSDTLKFNFGVFYLDSKQFQIPVDENKIEPSCSHQNESVTVYSKNKNNSSAICVVRNVDVLDVEHKSIYHEKTALLLDNIFEEMKYYLRFSTSKKNVPSQNVVSKLKKKSLLGESYILFKDYYVASAMLATFYAKNKFIIKNMLDNTLEVVDNIVCRNILMTTCLDNKKIIFFGGQEKVDKQLVLEEEKIKKEEEHNRTEYNIFVDGSSNIKRQMYSWAFVVYHNGKEIYFDKGHEEQKKYINHGSQIGEFLAMCNAMKYILENKLSDVTVWYDNVNNYNCMTTLSTTASTLYDIFAKYFQITSKMRKLMVLQNLKVEYRHSKAHSGIEGNERADRLAKKAIFDVNSIF